LNFKGGTECENSWRETEWRREIVPGVWIDKFRKYTARVEWMRGTCRRCLSEDHLDNVLLGE